MNGSTNLHSIDSKQIAIISGEGTGPGTVEEYKGKRSQQALKSRLTRERCHGQRWARGIGSTEQHDIFGQPIGINIETGEPTTYPA